MSIIKMSSFGPWFKAVNKENLEVLKRTNIPGYVGDYDLAMIYAEPDLTGESETWIVEIEYSEPIPDTTEEFRPWMTEQGYKDVDVSMGYPPEYKNKVWTAPGSAHGGRDSAYIGIPVKWKIVDHFTSQALWQKVWDKVR